MCLCAKKKKKKKGGEEISEKNEKLGGRDQGAYKSGELFDAKAKK